MEYYLFSSLTGWVSALTGSFHQFIGFPLRVATRVLKEVNDLFVKVRCHVYTLFVKACQLGLPVLDLQFLALLGI
jgi:hypothetical protein